MLTIRPFKSEDWPAVWSILKSVIEGGDAFSFSPSSGEDEIYTAWVQVPQATYIAESAAGTVVGTYYIKPNQPGLGSHVCNCGYAAAREARNGGIAGRLCEHSQSEALRLEYRAMQFNFVVVTNTGAVRLWQKLGFSIVGTLPEIFRHLRLGYVNAYVMHKHLVAA